MKRSFTSKSKIQWKTEGRKDLGENEKSILFSPIFYLEDNMMKKIMLVITNETLKEYADYYFSVHTRAKTRPLKQPYHESINEWMIMKRPIMNALKQKWKDFIIWFVNKQGYANLHIEKCEMKFATYYKTNRRHDIDNTCPKFILDGFSESGFIVDDDSKHLTKLTLQCFVDKENPRTEIEVYYE